MASSSLLETCAGRRAEILQAYYEMGRDAVARGIAEAPRAYVIPPAQHDPAAGQLVRVLRENGLEAHTAATELAAPDGRRFPAGSVVLPAAQPYRGFLLEMMERQRYPEVRQSPDTKDIFRPYDVTAWTLPLMMGVDWARVDGPLAGRLGGAPDSSWPGPPAPAGEGACMVAPAVPGASVRLVNRLLAGGVKVERALEAFEAGGRRFARVTGRCRAPDWRGRAAARRRSWRRWRSGPACGARRSPRRASGSTGPGSPTWTRAGPASCSTTTASATRASTTTP